jgi:hypothetical protein
VKRAYDLNLLGAVEYRAALKHMSRKGWNKREPHESRPQQSGVFEKVLNGLGQKATLTIDLPIEKLCEQLCFTPATFYEVTGIAIPPRNIAPSSGTEMLSAVSIGSPNRFRADLKTLNLDCSCLTWMAGRPHENIDVADEFLAEVPELDLFQNECTFNLHAFKIKQRLTIMQIAENFGNERRFFDVRDRIV